jgi:hypothetical protein
MLVTRSPQGCTPRCVVSRAARLLLNQDDRENPTCADSSATVGPPCLHNLDVVWADLPCSTLDPSSQRHVRRQDYDQYCVWWGEAGRGGGGDAAALASFGPRALRQLILRNQVPGMEACRIDTELRQDTSDERAKGLSDRVP